MKKIDTWGGLASHGAGSGGIEGTRNISGTEDTTEIDAGTAFVDGGTTFIDGGTKV